MSLGKRMPCPSSPSTSVRVVKSTLDKSGRNHSVSVLATSWVLGLWLADKRTRSGLSSASAMRLWAHKRKRLSSLLLKEKVQRNVFQNVGCGVS